ncbi:MAG TPA: glycosyltransferase family 1 protein [Patescibacteria group bacterium]|nr:glycosyltransferase family 1 protein [Patescibacteria group bacterium]
MMSLATAGSSASRRVVVNGRFLDQPFSGVQRFAWEVVHAMDALRQCEGDGGIPVELLCPAGTTELPSLATIPVRRVGRRRGYLWEQIELPLAARGALVLNLANMGPLFSRKITTIHDAIVWQMPGNYTPAFVAAYRLLLPLIARTSRHCVTVSEHSRRCLSEFGIVGQTPVSVVANGMDHIRRDGDLPSTMAWPERFVFALGNAAPNKNIALVRALAPRLREAGIMSVVAGGGAASVFAATPQADSQGVIALGRVPDAVIRDGYRRALAFLFPSFHEGFGIPPVEAMALGCPVIASNSSAMPEILGDAALLRDPRSLDQWQAAVFAIASDPRLRSSLIAKGFARADRYRWEPAARTMLALLER